MPGLKHAALLGIASGDRTLFAPAVGAFSKSNIEQLLHTESTKELR